MCWCMWSRRGRASTCDCEDAPVACIHNSSMAVAYDLHSIEFGDAAFASGRKAFAETLAVGLSVFYVDAEGCNMMERAKGQRFEIRWLHGAPSGENYEIVRELPKRAA
jgi:hypothetical protein